MNSLTGAFITSAVDLDLPGTGIPFSWTRTYTSAETAVSRLGRGWTDGYGASLEVLANGDVIAHGDEGQEVRYTKQANGSFVGAAGTRAALTQVAGGYELLRTDQVLYRFDGQGRMLSIKDRNDQGLTFGYDASNRLITITDAADRQATVSYNAANRVSQVQTQDGRSVSYGYTGDLLTQVTDVRGKVWTFTYDASSRLATIVDPLNHTQVTNVYGADSRVTSQTDALGKTATFGWDPATQTATVTDANGKVWTDDYEDNVLVERRDPLGNVTEFGRDDDLNPTDVTSPTGDTTAMTFDGNGNLLTATAPASLGGVQRTSTYNGRNDPTQLTDASGKVGLHVWPGGNLQSGDPRQGRSCRAHLRRRRSCADLHRRQRQDDDIHIRRERRTSPRRPIRSGTRRRSPTTPPGGCSPASIRKGTSKARIRPTSHGGGRTTLPGRS